jgi:glycosyltransferase involved in cell wall biosynthesis
MTLPSRTFLLLATYDGARFLDQQIDSIRSQTITDWTLLARDDDSSDGTSARLEGLSVIDSRIEVVRDQRGRLGPAGNFSALGQIAFDRGADRVFFVDQDDVWFPDKIARSLSLMAATEGRLGRATPILVHSDLEVIDCDGRRLHESFMRLQHIHHEQGDALTTLLAQNFVTGCAAAINRPLLELGTPVPPVALMHDWWFALCAAAHGRIAFIPDATAGYRRHGANAVAVRGFWRTLNPAATSWTELWRAGARSHAAAVQQAGALLERLSARPSRTGKAERIVGAFVDLHRSRQPALGRLTSAVRLGVRSQSLPRTLVLYLRLLAWKG